MSGGKRFIELYSGNRNRVQYPNPAQFEIPFSSTVQTTGRNAVDPVVNGGVYYKFSVDSDSVFGTEGLFSPGSTQANPIINLKPLYGEVPSTIVDYYVGQYLYVIDEDGNISIPHLITAYNPSTLMLTLSLPLKDDPNGKRYALSVNPPSINGQVSIPAVDINYNSILNYELAYNGYYVVFESENPVYSNPENSNIFSRKIKYYDNITRIAYFDPLPDGYVANSFDTFTLRQQVPEERWYIDTESFVNTVQGDQLVGPLVGPVITLPPTASSINNYYVGKFVYYYSNNVFTYPEELPDIQSIFSNTSTPIPGVFYPIYGSYYIKAYNGLTKELSVDYDINNTPLPSYVEDIGYNSGSFESLNDTLVITQIGLTTYQAVLSDIGGGGANVQPKRMRLTEYLYTYGKTYRITWRIKTDPLGRTPEYSPDISVVSCYNEKILGYFELSTISDEYITYTFSFIPTSEICFLIYPGDIGDTQSTYTIEWDLFLMSETPIINISSFKCENFTPLSYIGSTVSSNEAVCYEVDLISLTLPNASLLTGSRTSFYPYLYIEFTNATSPNGASRELIYSNNPHSKNALFIAATPNQVSPLLSTFVTLSGGGMSQVVKFKPNDNLRFSVYLPDGTLFKTLENDFFSPYLPSRRVQIDALFGIRRL